MNDQRKYTAEQLTGYLDGELDDAVANDIRAALVNDSQLQERLKLLSVNTPTIKAAFDGLLPDAPAAPDFLQDEHPSPGRLKSKMPSMAAIAATALFCLLVGGLAGAYITANRSETWQDFAATYHALYVNSTLSHVKQTPAAAAAELKRVTAAFGKKIELGTVSKVPQLDYKRSQILGFEGQPLIQIAFLSRLGVPIVLCIMRAGAADQPSQLQRSRMRGMRAVTWSKDRYEFLLIGGNDAALLDQAAADLVKRL